MSSPSLVHHLGLPVAECQKRPRMFTLRWLPGMAWQVATLGLSSVYYKTRRHLPASMQPVSLQSLPIHVDTYDDSRINQWKETIRHLRREWKRVSLGCGIILSLSIALLQIDLIIQNILGRTTAIMGFIFSGEGFILAASFELMIAYPKERVQYPKGWVKASASFDNLESVEFFSFLALPLALLIWSVVFCIIAVLTIPWTVRNDGSESNSSDSSFTYTGNIINGVFLMFVALMNIGPAYKAIKFAKELYH